MKNYYDRNWLENYKVIPKTDNTIYKNYQNPAMNSWDRQMASLSPAQKNRYNQFLNTIPSELQGLSAANMQKYLQDVDEKQNALAHERAGYESQIKKIQNDEAQRNAKPKIPLWMETELLNKKYNSELSGWGMGANQFGNGIIGKPYHQVFFRDIAPNIRNEINSGLSYKDSLGRVTQPYDYQNRDKPSNKYLGRYTHNPVGSPHTLPWSKAGRSAEDPRFHVLSFLQNGINGKSAIEGNDPGEEAYNYAMKYYKL